MNEKFETGEGEEKGKGVSILQYIVKEDKKNANAEAAVCTPPIKDSRARATFTSGVDWAVARASYWMGSCSKKDGLGSSC